jgi:hypothetical protein
MKVSHTAALMTMVCQGRRVKRLRLNPKMGTSSTISSEDAEAPSFCIRMTASDERPRTEQMEHAIALFAVKSETHLRSAPLSARTLLRRTLNSEYESIDPWARGSSARSVFPYPLSVALQQKKEANVCALVGTRESLKPRVQKFSGTSFRNH